MSESNLKAKLPPNDCFDLKPFWQRLEAFLITEHGFADGGLVVSLNAGFGSGKTTFLRFWEDELSYRRSREESVPMFVVLNAWESDYCGDPLVAVLTCLIEVVKKKNGVSAALVIRAPWASRCVRRGRVH